MCESGLAVCTLGSFAAMPLPYIQKVEHCKPDAELLAGTKLLFDNGFTQWCFGSISTVILFPWSGVHHGYHICHVHVIPRIPAEEYYTNVKQTRWVQWRECLWREVVFNNGWTDWKLGCKKWQKKLAYLVCVLHTLALISFIFISLRRRKDDLEMMALVEVGPILRMFFTPTGYNKYRWPQ